MPQEPGDAPHQPEPERRQASASPPPSPPGWAWTAPQRRVLSALLIVLAACLAARFACRPVYVSDPQPEWGSRAGDLVDRIDPNTADWQTLAALPSIGEKRARDVVAYRDRFTAANPRRRAFEQASNLLRIKGLGRAMVSAIEPHLIFPTTPSTTTMPTPSG